MCWRAACGPRAASWTALLYTNDGQVVTHQGLGQNRNDALGGADIINITKYEVEIPLYRLESIHLSAYILIHWSDETYSRTSCSLCAANWLLLLYAIIWIAFHHAGAGPVFD